MSDRETLRRINPGAYLQMLEIERTASAHWPCDGQEAASRYLTVMLSPEPCNEKAIPRPGGVGVERNKALKAVETLFLTPDAMLGFREILEKTELKRKTLTSVLCRMRERDLIRYAEGTTRFKPIFCHPEHPMALRKRGKR